jgi:hypothetical protein
LPPVAAFRTAGATLPLSHASTIRFVLPLVVFGSKTSGGVPKSRFSVATPVGDVAETTFFTTLLAIFAVKIAGGAPLVPQTINH